MTQKTMVTSITPTGELDTSDKEDYNCTNSNSDKEINDQRNSNEKVLNLPILKGGELERELMERKIRKNWILVRDFRSRGN